MKRLFTLLTILALALGSGVWVVLLSWTTDTITGLSEPVASALYFSAIFAMLAGGAVVAFGDRCLQFIGAVACVVAFLGLAAFHSSHTHHAAPIEIVAEVD